MGILSKLFSKKEALETRDAVQSFSGQIVDLIDGASEEIPENLIHVARKRPVFSIDSFFN